MELGAKLGLVVERMELGAVVGVKLGMEEGTESMHWVPSYYVSRVAPSARTQRGVLLEHPTPTAASDSCVLMHFTHLAPVTELEIC